MQPSSIQNKNASQSFVTYLSINNLCIELLVMMELKEGIIIFIVFMIWVEAADGICRHRLLYIPIPRRGLCNLFFSTGDISMRRLKLWEESFEELLCDQLGRDTLQKFLDKEYSGENLRFWWQVSDDVLFSR